MPAPNQLASMMNPEVLEALATLARNNVTVKVEEHLPDGWYRCSECGGTFTAPHYCCGKSARHSGKSYWNRDWKSALEHDGY